MRIKVQMEMGGNEFLDLLRKVPKAVATQLRNSAVTVTNGLPKPGEDELMWKSINEIIDTKKR